MTTNQTIDGVPLFPCPFCGELPVITKHFKHEMYSFMHRCPVIGPISRDFRETAQGHVDMWNTRVEQPAPVAVVGYDDPVAWANSKDLIEDGYTHSFTVRSEQPGNGYTDGGVPTPLYLRSGNSIVLPARFDESQYRGTSLLAVRRWNKCLDEVIRLNTNRPAHANPPLGTEPAGTHHDNDGLDEWRKP